MKDNNSYIRIEGLSYSYPEEKVNVLDDINVRIGSGEVVFVCGDSGSGKTTLGKCITGAVPGFYGGTMKGSVTVNGIEISRMKHSERASEITMVFQDPERQLLMSKVHREIAFGLENIGVETSHIKRRVWESMQFCNILDLWDREIRTLSGGQKQKVAVAAAIAYMPKCIIFDEPTSQLDPLAAEEIIALIGKINRELGTTAVIIEQRVERCFEISDKILLLDKGRVCFYGSREEFYSMEGRDWSRYLPVHLRIAKHAGAVEMPASIKETRRLISAISEGAAAQPYNEDSKRLDYDLRGNKEEQLRIKGLSVGYGSGEVIRKLDCSVCRGDFVGIFGPNGAGKSTLLKAVTGLLKYRGSITVEGSEVSRYRNREIGKVFGYVSQNPNDYISKDTVYDELRFTLDNYGITDYSSIEEVLKELDLEGVRDKNPRDLSGGERQRVAIASVLVNKPSILLLDEPTRGLDSQLKLQLGKLLAKLNSEGMTIILVTHDIEFASEFCERYLLLFSGEIISSGTREEVMRDGIFYTTAANKIFRDIAPDIFTVSQAKGWLSSDGR
ncbi:MAG TPA: energy-coupling factor transporter ATPase [Clostridiaceae bacterium]